MKSLRHKPWAKIIYGLGLLSAASYLLADPLIMPGVLVTLFSLDDIRP
jgi:hypothetical protein